MPVTAKGNGIDGISFLIDTAFERGIWGSLSLMSE